MTELFVTIINMSWNASLVALIVLLLRLILKRAPKIFSYGLWSIVFFRLLCPFHWESVVSLLPAKAEPITPAGLSATAPYIDTGISPLNQTVGKALSTMPISNPETSINTMQAMIGAMSAVWAIGVIIASTYLLARFVFIRNKVKTATLIKGIVYETDHINTPFVFGIIKPHIYLPIGMDSYEQEYILQHEYIHIRRKDYLIKPIAFFAVILHWFNPIVWISFFFMVKDMEMSCDESVMKGSKEDIRVDYSKSLLNLSMKQNGFSLPPSFGESHTKSRIKNVLNYKKTKIWILAASFLILLAAAITLLSNPKPTDIIKNETSSADVSQLALDLYENKTQYIGNHIQVINLISLLPVPGQLGRDGIQLFTTKEPYGLQINYHKNQRNAEVEVNTILKNAILLFSSIDNMGKLEFIIYDYYGYESGNESNPINYQVSYTRDEIEEMMGCDVREYGESPESFQELLNLTEQIGISDSVKQEALARVQAIPKDYQSDKAIEDGCFVIVHGSLKSDAALMDTFIQKSKEGQKCNITIVQYTVEGDPIISDVTFSNGIYYILEDSSRDTFGGGNEYYENTFSAIKKFKSENGESVYLLNDDMISYEAIQKNILSSTAVDPIPCYLLYDIN